jgi:ketosteroid isomerase-like protein
MSRENVELARQVWAAYQTGGVDAISGYYALDAIVEDIPELPDGRTYVGFEGARERYWHFVRAWGDFNIEPVEFIDGGGDCVVVITAMAGRAPASGLSVEAPAVFVWEVRDREIVRDRVFMSKQAALKAAGLADG